MGFDERICPEEWRQGGLDFLRAIPQLSGRPGEGVASLELPAQLLSLSTAPLIAGAFPSLARLVLSEAGELSPDASHEAARGLALLLNGGGKPEGGGVADGATAGAVGEGAVGGGTSTEAGSEGVAGVATQNTAPLLPRLVALRFGPTPLKRLPPGFGTVLWQSSQLRTLEFKSLALSVKNQQEQEQAEDSRGPLEDIASLTQLTALSLYSCAVPLLPVLTGALTRLTSLSLGFQRSSLSPALFAPLQGLQRLEIPDATLEAAGLAEALSSLTRLSVGGFTLSAQELSQPLTSIPRWRLPAGLRELGLGTDSYPPAVPPEILAGLELHPGLCLDRCSTQGSFVLHPGRHTATPAEDGDDDEEGGFVGTELLPAAEEALCGALRFVHRNGLLWKRQRSLSITFKAQLRDQLLQPVGGAAGTGPGRPNHGRWLREVAALRPTDLTLEGIRLSYQDVETVKQGMQELQTLIFEPPIELRGQAIASIVGLVKAMPEKQALTLDLSTVKGLGFAAAERVRSLGLRVRAQVEACGVEPILITAEGLTVEVDPNEPDDVD
ncbi:hypothetical protein HYH03_001143 [Edaphochlamys debaryana]|uniref:Uncharacterized protein n=1 Tax=Edaphochlamys debaryana TaxID=47281 RepID=A0A835YHL5_9CHLO|nr:hypothetical protein HYH03_001143 [Edaphochlamys debaryana]|eukprot:KAG2501353.1 hypothetical protein HYH03_001143 [Edaphochlamys debaryana]